MYGDKKKNVVKNVTASLQGHRNSNGYQELITSLADGSTSDMWTSYSELWVSHSTVYCDLHPLSNGGYPLSYESHYLRYQWHPLSNRHNLLSYRHYSLIYRQKYLSYIMSTSDVHYLSNFSKVNFNRIPEGLPGLPLWVAEVTCAFKPQECQPIWQKYSML